MRLKRQLATLMQLTLAGVVGGAAWDGVQLAWRTGVEAEAVISTQEFLRRPARLASHSAYQVARETASSGRAVATLSSRVAMTLVSGAGL
jgi:hypothetical protein